MKRILLTVAFLTIGLVMSAQTVTSNERNEHGVRIIDTDMGMVYEDGKLYGISLSYHEVHGVENYYIMFCIPEVSDSFQVLTDQRVLFKTASENKPLGLASIDARISYGAAAGRVMRSAVCLYVITPETAQMLATEGVSKMRIYYTSNMKETFFDIETTEGNISKYLKKAYKNIVKTIPQPVTKDKSEF